jgi:hypothetical protein
MSGNQGAANDGDWSRALFTVRNCLGYRLVLFMRDRELSSLVATFSDQQTLRPVNSTKEKRKTCRAKSKEQAPGFSR